MNMTMRFGRGLALALPMAAALIFWAAPGEAQEPDPELVSIGEQVWKTKASCRECHGGLGTGVPDNHQAPKGSSFRTTMLSEAELAEVIKCGRIATPMPSFDRRAYEDKRCYDSTAADLGSDVPPKGVPNLNQREINALAAFITAKFKDKGEPTVAECEAFWGAGASSCQEFAGH